MHMRVLPSSKRACCSTQQLQATAPANNSNCKSCVVVALHLAQYAAFARSNYACTVCIRAVTLCCACAGVHDHKRRQPRSGRHGQPQGGPQEQLLQGAVHQGVREGPGVGAAAPGHCPGDGGRVRREHPRCCREDQKVSGSMLSRGRPLFYSCPSIALQLLHQSKSCDQMHKCTREQGGAGSDLEAATVFVADDHTTLHLRTCNHQEKMSDATVAATSLAAAGKPPSRPRPLSTPMQRLMLPRQQLLRRC